MIALLSLVVLTSSKTPARAHRVEARPLVFSERLTAALGEAWRVMIG